MITLPSPHFKPGPQQKDLLVVHSMGEFVTNAAGRPRHAADLLDELGLSAHYLITPDGRILQLVAERDVAWHAAPYNTHSIGVEFLVQGLHDYTSFLAAIKDTRAYTRTQWWVGVKLFAQLAHEHSITQRKQLVTHAQLDPTRKVDPGEGFAFAEFVSKVSEELGRQGRELA